VEILNFILKGGIWQNSKEECIKLYALIVGKKRKFLFSHRTADQFTVENAIARERELSNS
jgi:hypothetical protein